MSDVVEVLYRDTVVVESGDNKVIVIEPKVIINQTTGGTEQIQSDWNQTDNTKKDFIKNKPTIPDELADLADDDTHRTVTDIDKEYWNNKAEALDYALISDVSEMITDAKNPIVLPVNTNYDTLVTNGVYQVDYNIITVKVANDSSAGDVVNQVLTADDGTMQYRQYQNGAWSAWKELADESDIANLYTALADSIGDAMSTIDDKVDKVAGKGLSTNDYTNTDKAIVDKVAVIPVNPERMYLNGNKEYTEIISGSGGYANDVFFTYDESDVSGYYKLSYTPPENEVELTATVQASEGTKLIRTYLYDLPIGINIHDAGLWAVNYTARVTSAANETHLIFEAFMRDVNGNETVLFTKTGAELNSTSNMMYTDSTVQPSYIVEPTSRFGVKIYATTTRTVSTRFYTTIGGRDASHFNSPIALRHSQLRDKNQEDAYQHITSDEKDLFLLSDRFRINATDFIGGTASPYQGIVIGGVPVIVKKFLNQNSYYYTTVRLPSGSIYLDNIRFILTESVMPTAGQYIDFTINGKLLRHSFNGTEVQNQMITTNITIGYDDVGNQVNTLTTSGTYLQKIGIVSMDFFYSRGI